MGIVKTKVSLEIAHEAISKGRVCAETNVQHQSTNQHGKKLNVFYVFIEHKKQILCLTIAGDTLAKKDAKSDSWGFILDGKSAEILRGMNKNTLIIKKTEVLENLLSM